MDAAVSIERIEETDRYNLNIGGVRKMSGVLLTEIILYFSNLHEDEGDDSNG